MNTNKGRPQLFCKTHAAADNFLLVKMNLRAARRLWGFAHQHVLFCSSVEAALGVVASAPLPVSGNPVGLYFGLFEVKDGDQ